jgi:hypothetical protein
MVSKAETGLVVNVPPTFGVSTLVRLSGRTTEKSVSSRVAHEDLASGYFQLKIAEKDSHKTAFCTPFGQYEWRVLPQGLCNAPSSFMQAMNSIFDQRITDEDYRSAGVDPSLLSHKVGRFSEIVLVYLDDLLIKSHTCEDHLEHLKLVLHKLKDCNLHLKFS